MNELIDKWKITTLLDNCITQSEEEKLSLLLEKAYNIIVSRNKQDDLISSILIPATARLFYDIRTDIIFDFFIIELEKADRIDFNGFSNIDVEMEKMFVAIENYKELIK